MAKVIQIRGVPDETHASLVRAAERAGQSLTAFLSVELGRIADRAAVLEHNRRVILAAQAEFAEVALPREETLLAIQEGRAERDRQFDERFGDTGT